MVVFFFSSNKKHKFEKKFSSDKPNFNKLIFLFFIFIFFFPLVFFSFFFFLITCFLFTNHWFSFEKICFKNVRQPLCTHWLVHKKIKEKLEKKNRELRKKIRPSLVENTISLKQIRLLHRCFENCKASVSQDKTIFEWQQQHSAATPANWKLFNSITDTERRNS